MGPYDPHPRLSRLVLVAGVALLLASLAALPASNDLVGAIGWFIGHGLPAMAVFTAVAYWAVAGPALLPGRSRGWWITRIELAVGIAAVALGGWVAVATQWNSFGASRAWLLPIPIYILPAVAYIVTAVVGLAWMIRIYRGPNDEALAWRYRDR